MRAHPTLALFRALLSAWSAELGFLLVCVPSSAAVGTVIRLVSDHRQSVPSVHIRCMTGEPACEGDLAPFTLPLFAIRMAQDRSDDHRP